ncbi:ABC transporter permease subunit [Thermococcus sp.]|uniref:ABC transporter permease subunit n=1 Tax=Thermococcus sp. TaxID=35749 RepID=UPI00262FD1A8|nr:ABC transporter permease subunit [Thermococcus sp.]
MGGGRSLLYIILRNAALFLTAFLITSTVITWAQWSTTHYQLQDTYLSMLRFIQTTPSLQERANQSGMTYEEYAWYLTYRSLNIRPGFIETMKTYFRQAWDIMEHGLGKWGSAWAYVRNTFAIFLLAEAGILLLGLYLGLRAGYNGGKTERLVSALAPFLSAIPSWFIGAILFLILWDLGYTPDFQMRLQDASTHGGINAGTYLLAYLGPALAVFLVMVFEYAFIVKNLIAQERISDHVLADRAKGLPDGKIRRKVLKTALAQFLAYTTYNLLEVLTAVFVVEIIFNVRGMGYLLLASFRVVYKPPQGIDIYLYPQLLIFVSLVMLALYFVVSTVMEGIYVRLDPRVSRGE